MVNSGEAKTQTTKNWDEVLEGLPSHNIYKYFNENKNIGNNYDKDCEIKINDKTEYPEFKEICKNFAKKLEDILRNVHGKETINYCMLLKYWVYEQIKKKCKFDKTIFEVFILTEKLKNMQYSIEKLSPVNFECYDYYNDYMGDWQEEKDLFEYFINFDEFNTRIKSKKNEHEKYKEYVKHILGLYLKKKKRGCCKIKYYHLCDHYFRCDPKYDPKVLLSMLGESTGTESSSETKSSSETDIHGIDISEEISRKKKYDYDIDYTPTGSDIVIPNVRVGWHKSKNKYKSRIQNVRCLMNYAIKDSRYALVSCYNFEKGYQDYEHIFRPTVEEDAFYSELKEKESHDRASSSSVNTNQFPIDTNKNGKVATKSNITPVIPESIRGYSPLGELINEKKDDFTGEYQASRVEAYTFASTSRKHDLWEEKSRRVPCTYIKINENGTKECVKKEKLNEIIVFTDTKGQSLNTVENVERPSSIDLSTDEYPDNFETTGNSIFKTPMFRGSTLAALLVGVVFVFFIYYKFTPFGRWVGRKDSKEKNRYMEIPIEGEQNYLNEYYGDPQRRNVQNQPVHAPSPSPKSPSSSSRKMDPPKERIRIAYHTS